MKNTDKNINSAKRSIKAAIASFKAQLVILKNEERKLNKIYNEYDRELDRLDKFAVTGEYSEMYRSLESAVSGADDELFEIDGRIGQIHGSILDLKDVLSNL